VEKILAYLTTWIERLVTFEMREKLFFIPTKQGQQTLSLLGVKF